MIALVAWASVAPTYFSAIAHSVNGFITTSLHHQHECVSGFRGGYRSQPLGRLRLGPDDSTLIVVDYD